MHSAGRSVRASVGRVTVCGTKKMPPVTFGVPTNVFLLRV
jgi:hypothetical protein